jgi:hypothetical protein
MLSNQNSRIFEVQKYIFFKDFLLEKHKFPSTTRYQSFQRWSAIMKKCSCAPSRK